MKLNLNVFGEFPFTHCIHSLKSVELDQDADSRFYGDIGTVVLVWVTMLFGINSTSNVIEIVRGEAECYFNCFRVLLIPNSTGYPCYHSLIVGQLFKKSLVIVAILVMCLSTNGERA